MNQSQTTNQSLLGRRQQGDQQCAKEGNPQDEAEHVHEKTALFFSILPGLYLVASGQCR
jgi:hypothetical protein